MNTPEFDRVVETQLLDCMQTLKAKAEEYATDGDRLHNFKVAANLQHVTARRALSGMMAKHIISIFDMCATEEEYSDALWNEKIKDTINYCLLLKAIVQEEKPKVRQMRLDGVMQEPPGNRIVITTDSMLTKDVVARLQEGIKRTGFNLWGDR